MPSISTLASLLLLAAPSVVYASPCVTFDVDFNLLAFGFNGKDWNAGQQTSWGSGSATDITASGRPPFDGASTTCYLAQFFNAVYVLNGDAANPSDVHIYNAASKSWTTQKTNLNKLDISDFKTILDHDTNVFYGFSKGELWSLDMGEKTAAASGALDWEDNEASPYGADYQPTMALAQNHIHLIDTPGTTDGTLSIFVIHFSYFQPETQRYSGVNFPAKHGQATSFFQTDGVQQEFAFIPDDGSATFVINVENNSTAQLAGPTSKDPKATYAASITALVQLDSAGAVSYLPYKQGDASGNTAAKWASVAKLAASAPPSSSDTPNSTGSPSGSSNSTKATGSGTGAPAGTRQSTSPTATGGASGDQNGTNNNGAMNNAASFGAIAAAALAVFASSL